MADSVTELLERLEYHSTGSGVLQGLTFYDAPVQRADGQKDLPVLMILTVGMEEADEGRTFVSQTLEVRMELKTSRDDGLAGLWQWVAKVQNAIDRDTTGAVNPNLKTRRPPTFRVAQDLALDLSFAAQITVALAPKAARRGER